MIDAYGDDRLHTEKKEKQLVKNDKSASRNESTAVLER